MTAVALRSPDKVLNLRRMGSYHQTRLSFMRSLLRLAHREAWEYRRARWQMDERGVGHAVYEMRTPHGIYSLLAFAHDLPDDMRSDRVIATAWDATFALLQGEVNDDDIARLQDNVPHQEAGRVSAKEICMSRANRSMRLWQHAQQALAEGKQPDEKIIAEVGYLMRTTAVYGNAKFGTATRFGNIANQNNGQKEMPENSPKDNNPMTAPFRVEMLLVWLVRNFSLDWLDYMAELQGGKTAVKLDEKLRRRLGIGNSTGLGMAPFVVNHPLLTHRWVYARESALAHVLSQENCSEAWQARFHKYCEKASALADRFHSQHELQVQKNKALRADFQKLQNYLPQHDWQAQQTCHALYLWGEQNLSIEGQEMLVSLLLEAAGGDAGGADGEIDDFCDSMSGDEDENFFINGDLPVDSARRILSERFAWLDNIDFTDKRQRARFWYVSEDKLEPRLGERYEEQGAEREQFLGVAYGMYRLRSALDDFITSHKGGNKSGNKLADFLLAHPEHRFCVRRLLLADKYAYGEIHDNILSADMMPIDILRFKLSFFGATNFDPRSDRWVRITMYQGAPFPEQIKTASRVEFDDWVYEA